MFENATFYLSDQIYIVHVPNYIVVECKNDETCKIPKISISKLGVQHIAIIIANIQSFLDKNELALSGLGIFLRIFFIFLNEHKENDLR